MINQWDNSELAHQYATRLDEIDWYEHEVNTPSLMELMRVDATSALDFGSGPGQFTKLISEKVPIIGADSSEAMRAIASRAYPEIDFIDWDGQSPYPEKDRFDVIFSKLTLHFVDDLDLFSREAKNILNPNGTIIISVPHPVRQLKMVNGNYAPRATFDGKIGGYGLTVKMIYRPAGEYIQPFLANGFVLRAFEEPLVSPEQQRKHDAPKEDLHIPKRLNLAFQLAS